MTGPDYGRLLDAEIHAYIVRCDSFYPPDAVTLSIAEQRAVYDQMAAAFHRGRPGGVDTWDEQWGGVPCRRYETTETRATVIYYHGGGFVVGGLESHDDVCAEICARTGFRVISVDYGLAPEVVFPGCFDDAWAAFAAIAQEIPGSLVLAGDSAGGNLAAAVSHHARSRITDRIAGQVLIYPGLGGSWDLPSYVEHAEAPHLKISDMAFYHRLRTGGGTIPVDDPRYAPLHDQDFTGLPPTVVLSVACDPLASDGEAYRDAIQQAGGRAHWENAPGLIHGCLRARGMSRRAEAFFDAVVAEIAALGRGDWRHAEAEGVRGAVSSGAGVS